MRQKVAGQVQLAAYDLVDEVVYGWTQDPVFDKPTPVVLAGVSVPVGLGSGLQALLENHVNDVILKNPTTHITLVHCPACTQLIVRSGPEATVVTRGIDQPEVLEELGVQSGLHALFIDVEAEGAYLVLRARLTRVDSSLAIVWSRTIATTSASPSLLRSPDQLKSAEEAREEYLDALRDRGPAFIVSRLGARVYAKPFDSSRTAAPPFAWVQLGAELGTTQSLDWTVSLTAGGSYIPQAYQGLMAETRINRLITGRARSHTHPDVYAFLGGAVMTVWGPQTTPFEVTPANSDVGNNRYIMGSILLGLDLRLGNRMGFDVFVEHYPSLRRSENVGDFATPLGVKLKSIGTEVSVWF